MKKRKGMLSCIVFMIAVQLCACGEKVEIAKVQTTEAVKKEQVQEEIEDQGNNSFNEVIELKEVPKQSEEMRQKLVEAEEIVGFSPVTLPEVTGYITTSVNVLQKEGQTAVLEVNYQHTDLDTARLYTRKSEGSMDITDLTNIVYGQTDVNGHMIQTGEGSGRQIAVWTDDTYSYAVIGTDMEQDDFLSLVGVCLKQ